MFAFATVKYNSTPIPDYNKKKSWKKRVSSMFLQKTKHAFTSCIQGGNRAEHDFEPSEESEQT